MDLCGSRILSSLRSSDSSNERSVDEHRICRSKSEKIREIFGPSDEVWPPAGESPTEIDASSVRPWYVTRFFVRESIVVLRIEVTPLARVGL